MTEPPITSNITVDPGNISSFADFLEQMRDEIAALESTLAPYADEHTTVDFGAYPSSASARQRHLTATRDTRDNIAALVSRTDELVTGSHDLAARYTDLGALNASGATAVSTTLDQPGEDA